MLYLLSLILITAQAQEFEVLSEPVDLPSSEEVMVELLTPTDEIIQLPTEELSVIDSRETEININAGAEPLDDVSDDAVEVIQSSDEPPELSATEEIPAPEPVEDSVDRLHVPPTPEPTLSLSPDVSITPGPTDVPPSTHGY